MKCIKQFMLSAAFLISIVAVAQENKNEVWVSFGVSAPKGDFGSLTATEAGFAKRGKIFMIAGERNVNTYVAIFAGISSAKYSVDAEEMEAAFQQFFPPLPVSGTFGSWSLTTIQVGPVFRYPIAEKFIAEARLNFGLAFASSPESDFTFANMLRVEQSSKLSNNFVIGLGAGIKWYITPKVFVPLHFGWQFTTQAFINVKGKATDYTVWPAETYSTSSDFDQQMNTFSSTIGIGCAF